MPFSKEFTIDAQTCQVCRLRNGKGALTPEGAFVFAVVIVITCDEAIKNDAGDVVELRPLWWEPPLVWNPECYKPKVDSWKREACVMLTVNLTIACLWMNCPIAKNYDRLKPSWISLIQIVNEVTIAKAEPSLCSLKRVKDFSSNEKKVFCRWFERRRVVLIAYSHLAWLLGKRKQKEIKRHVERFTTTLSGRKKFQTNRGRQEFGHVCLWQHVLRFCHIGHARAMIPLTYFTLIRHLRLQLNYVQILPTWR